MISDTGYLGIWLFRDGESQRPLTALSSQGPFRDGGRYWDRTSDLFRVRDRCRGQHPPVEREQSVDAALMYPSFVAVVTQLLACIT